jgi:integrase
MASVVERFAGKGEKKQRRLYVVAWITDRETGKRRKMWELQASTLKNDANARKAKLELELRKSGGLWPTEETEEPEEPEEPSVTFAAYRDEWLADRARNVSERQLGNDRDAFRLYLSPKFETIPLEAIKRTHVKALVGELVDAGLGRNAIRNALAPLRRMMREAVRDELIPSNPAADIEISDQAPVRPASVPTREELDKILLAAKVDARDAITLMAALGLRRGEAFALRWADCDFDANLVHVHATNHRGRVADRTKTKAGTRLVPLFPSAKATLEARKRRLSPAPHPTAFVFGNTIGGAMDPGNWARREWLPALKKAGYEKRFHVHELRHFAATALDEQGMKGKLRTEIVGHANEEITNSVYTHVRRERVAAVASDFDPLGEASSG